MYPFLHILIKKSRFYQKIILIIFGKPITCLIVRFLINYEENFQS